jgi:hypothetical protein
MEILNEVTVFVIGIHCEVILGFVDDVYVKEQVGISMICFILLMLLVNALVVVVDFIKQAYLKIKKEYRRQKLLRLMRLRPASKGKYRSRQPDTDISVELSGSDIDLSEAAMASWLSDN